jgi:hypothetical protein
MEVHVRARELAETALARRALPTVEELIRRTRRSLGRLWRKRARAEFLRSASPSGMLTEFYYHSDTAPEDAAATIRDRMEPAHENLVGSPVCEELAEAGSAALHSIDAPLHFRHSGVDVWVAPDLVYRTEDGWAVVDWKTGFPWGVEDQTAAYGLYLRSSGLAPGEPVCTARVSDLTAGVDRIRSVTADDLDGATARVRAAADDLVALARRQHPPPHVAVRACETCPFRELCADPQSTYTRNGFG